MPFATCQSCGRLFHFLDPTLPPTAEATWRTLEPPDSAGDLCPECLTMAKTEPSQRDMAESNAHVQDPHIVAGPQARTAVQDPPEVESAWRKWSREIQPDSARDTAQLREAFEAGWNARG